MTSVDLSDIAFWDSTPDERAQAFAALRASEPISWQPQSEGVLILRRTATEDTRLGDVEIAEGEKVVLLYLSANRDEAAFDAPDRFDVRRDPNPHVGFGGAARTLPGQRARSHPAARAVRGAAHPSPGDRGGRAALPGRQLRRRRQGAALLAIARAGRR